LPGEELQLYNGQTAKVVQILPRPGPEQVHNIEVLNEHVYRVTESGILVHNECTVTYEKKALKNRPTATASENYVETHLKTTDPNGVERQRSYFQNEPAKYGTKGSTRPDLTVNNTHHVEVKNYDILTNTSSLISHIK
jgi:hypothetical protein